MSMIKRHIDNKVEELAEALDMPYDTMMDWFIIKVVNSEEDLGRGIKDLAKCYNRTYDDVFDYVLLCMALMPDRDPVHTVFEFFRESTAEKIRAAQNELCKELIYGMKGGCCDEPQIYYRDIQQTCSNHVGFSNRI